MRLAADWGGTISAEHGVGVAMARWLALTRSPASFRRWRPSSASWTPTGSSTSGRS
jgi:FAD/FMN-containing dehydrogenase